MGILIERGDTNDWVESDFALPMRTDKITSLVGQYRALRSKLQGVSTFMQTEGQGLMPYFIDGNTESHRFTSTSIERLFQADGALAALNASFWSQALNLTDVLDLMPQERRQEWLELIHEHKTPDFDEDTVHSTLKSMLASRSQYFAESVDGIFRSLSSSHVTNRPEGFAKKMIMEGVVNCAKVVDTAKAGHINDLRGVIARFMGRDEPSWFTTSQTIRLATDSIGRWISLDGNALRIKVFKKGTVHLEVHEDMVWRLNGVLASLYPAAIPAAYRQRPAKKARQFNMIKSPLPFAVIDVLSEALGRRRNDDKLSIPYSLTGSNRKLRDQVRSVIEMIGGVMADTGGYDYQFDYNPEEVLTMLVTSGVVPEQKSHQFYPTQEQLGITAMDHAEIDEHHDCLEPSAGSGGLAQYMPKDQTLCVEISELHCAVLKERGHSVIRDDFLNFASITDKRFDRVVMNPPFADGRAQLHLVAAASLLRAGGRLVAILPASMKGSGVLPGFDCEWLGPYENQFKGTGVRVTMLVAQLKSPANT